MTEKIKLVHCNRYTYVYDYENPKNIATFTFETESMQLKYLMLTNFINDYVTFDMQLFLHKKDIPVVTKRLEAFIKQFPQKGLRYIAVLDLTNKHPCIRLLINKAARISDEELINTWGDKIRMDYKRSSDILKEYRSALRSTAHLKNDRIFKSKKLEQPKILHNKAAELFIEKNNLIDYDQQNTYERYDEFCGEVILNTYINLP